MPILSLSRAACALGLILGPVSAAFAEAEIYTLANGITIEKGFLNASEEVSHIRKRATEQWEFDLYSDDGDCAGEYRYVSGYGDYGCQNLDFDFTWNTFRVFNDATHDVVLFHARDCPYTDNDPFHYDCTTNLCLIGYGQDIPQSYLVTERGSGSCNN